ncbi:MAG: CYTH domain-containing protein [Chloroflexi bacterium]|nr:MAG: CYTH domain-containing protein [Chloroflexota bacterium]
MNNYLETEIKLLVDDLNIVHQRLIAVGARLIKPRVFERNIRYENADNTMTKQHKLIRLRVDDRVRLTYKEPAPQRDEVTTTRLELEVTVDDFDTMDLILRKMGYHPYLIYEKFRTTYELYKAEIVLDELPYGSFVEVEGEPQIIQQVIDTLQLNKARRFKTNYVTLFERVKQYLALDCQDLLFANFEGVQVPLSAFDPPDGDIF